MIHCSNLVTAYTNLKKLYGDKLSFFTKSDLGYDKFDYFPHPLPDAYIRLQTSRGERQFFLNIFEDTEPYFVLVRRTKNYVGYADSGDWAGTNTELPAILMAAAHPSVEKRLRKRLARELEDSFDDELIFATTTLPELLAGDDAKGRIWRIVEEFADNPDEPVKPRGLHLIAKAPDS